MKLSIKEIIIARLNGIPFPFYVLCVKYNKAPCGECFCSALMRDCTIIPSIHADQVVARKQDFPNDGDENGVGVGKMYRERPLCNVMIINF